MRLAQRAAWLLAAPWRLVVAVAVLAAVPIVVSGELAAADTVARHESAAANLAGRAAFSSASAVAQRVGAIALVIGNAALRAPRTGKATPIIEALDRGDEAAVQNELEAMHRFVDPAVTLLLVLDSSARLVAVDPFARGAAGTDLSARPFARYGRDAVEVSDAFLSATDITRDPTGTVPLESRVGNPGASAISLSVTAPIGTTQPLGYRLVAIAGLSELAGSTMSQLRPTYQDAYLLDRGGHLALRASRAFSPDDLAFRDLTAVTGRAGETDPLSPDRRIRGVARVADIGWSVFVVDTLQATSGELEAALLQQRALRVGLAGVLVLGALMVGSAASTALRRRRETAEALEQQTATSDVLKTISQSAFDLRAVFDVVVENALSLCRGDFSYLFRREGDVFQIVASRGGTPELVAYEYAHPTPLSRDTLIGRVALERNVVHIPDLFEDPAYNWPSNRAAGVHTVLGVPIFKDDEVVGAIGVARNEKRPFSEAEIRLIRTFADQAAIAIENVRLFNETKEALERQTATAGILEVISRSTSNLQPVLDTVVAHAERLCAADYSFVFLRGEGGYRIAAWSGGSPELVELEKNVAVQPGRRFLVGRVALEGRPVQIPDVLADPEYGWHEGQKVGGYRTMLGVPLFRGGEVAGVLGVFRNEVKPFTAGQIELLRIFADQSVIAIENVRLFNETKDALERQTATSSILGVISRSPADQQPTLDAIVESGARLCDADMAFIYVVEERFFKLRAGYKVPPAFVNYTNDSPIPVVAHRGSLSGRVMAERRAVQIPDVLADAEYEYLEGQRLVGYRAMLNVPMFSKGELIGLIGLWRSAPVAFTTKQIDLMTTFADQAVIAIENTRLFNETKDALERQTALAEILSAISASPTETQPVFGAIARNAARYCSAEDAVLHLVDGSVFRPVAHFGPIGAMSPGHEWPVDRSTVSGRAIVDRTVVQVDDLQAADAEFPLGAAQARDFAYHSVLVAPLLRKGEPIGALLLRRLDTRPFATQQVDLLRAFADQAVISIENVRLFNETKEALEQQTAVSDVLKTISRSAFDLQPVLDIVLNNAVRLAGADIGWLSRVEDEQFTTVAYSAEFPESVREELVRQRAQGHIAGPWIPLGTGGGLMGFTLAEGHTVHLPDVKEDPELRGSTVARLTESRTVVGVPMLRDGRSIGGMVLARYEVRPFTERELDLVQTFADQAAIAIENVRLFNATTASLERQTAISEVLKTISGTVLELDPTLQTVVETAARLADADAAWMTQRAGAESYKGGASYGRTADLQNRLLEHESTRAGTGWTLRFSAAPSIMSVAYREQRTVNVADIELDAEMRDGSVTARVVGARSIVAVPVRTENGVVGVMVLARVTVRPFSSGEIELIETFADQAAIAIQNVRLFTEIQDKSRELEIASRHKSEFLANMSHELRTPLNAIIGFSEVLLQGLFGEVNDKQREYLADVLGSGQHLLSLINDILDLSKIEAGRMDLELSTFRFRDALDSGLTIVRERAARHAIQLNAVVASDVGTLEADERKVKQILYNLLSNAVKFTPDGGRVDVSARADNGDVRVEVRDTGIGVAPEDQEQIFEEFRQVGRERSREGTGLGLTLTKRFVELHGGRIWLESTPGQGSTFTFTLPLRRAAEVRA